MQTWSQIIDYFTDLKHTYPTEKHGRMLTLVRHLSRQPDMMMVNRAVGLSAQDLLLWVPPSSQIVHVQAADDEEGFYIFLDNQAEGTFDGEHLHANFEEVLPLVARLIRRSLA